MNDKVRVKKEAPSFEVANNRALRASAMTTGQGENIAAPAPAEKVMSDKSYKACVKFMQEHNITDINSLDIKRLNCDIPKVLHNWLNVYSRTSDEYSSMTEIVIDIIGKFAKERGFKVGE